MQSLNDQNNLNGKSLADRSKVKATSKEFEDIEILSILKTNRFSKLSDCDALFHRHCGTFPLRSKSASSKAPVGGVLFDGKIKKISSDIELEKIDQDNSLSDYKSPILHSSALSYSQPSSSSSASLSSDTDTKRSSLDRKKDTSVSISNSTMPYKVVNVKDIINDEKDEMKTPDLPKKLSDKYSSDLDDADSLESFNPQIDLESSSAGMDLVDLLNDVLARYSDGESFKSIEDHELLPEVVSAVSEEIEKGEEASELNQSDVKALKGSLKSKQFEKKIASLAASLDLSKQKGKKQAPRPPTSPPPPEPVSPTKKTSPVHTVEPSFKMVPIGKPIIDHTVSPSQRKTSSSELTEDGMEGSKMRIDNKSKKGITSFFRNILRRGRDSVDGSSDTMAAGDSSSSLSLSEGLGNQSDKKSAEIETKEKNPIKSSSPQMKTKVLPPVSGNTRNTRTSVMVAFAEKPKSEKLSDSSLTEKAEGSESSSPKTTKQEVNIEKGSDGNKMEDKNVSEKGSAAVSGSPVQTSSGGVVKPPIAARPKPVPSSQKPSISPQASQKETSAKSSPIRERKSSTGSESEHKTENLKRNDSDNVIVRRRAKSPKRSAAPTRPSVAPKGLDNRHSVFTKELEMRLSKNVDHMKVSPPPAPAAPPSAKSAKTDQKKLTAPQPPASPTSPKETTSPSVVMETKEDNNSDQVSQEKEKVVEKIELPTTHSSRRSFLGKLGKGKSKAAPRPPQNVKRTKSITENSIQGGSTSSGSTNEKYDEWPEFSPLGSFENLYEPIVPTSSTLIPSEGYLEPVRSNTDTAITSSHVTNETSHVISNNGHAPEDYGEDISEERKKILASQPIYEEINGEGKEPPMEEKSVQKTALTVDTSLSVCEKDSQPILDSPSPSQLVFSSESEPSSASSTLNRPKPIPRKRQKKTESFNSEQPYVAMNRPSIAVALNEAQLRDLLNQLTSMNLHVLRDIYTQYEKVFLKDTVSLNITGAGPLKWHDFDIYGKPVHASERCIVYNAKLKSTSPHCQLLH
ncbi:hypothetical protein KUTeg_015711 [Tegillarca granosa]|uniref:Uncharacterized protein n=1 Tax=Tegillarca granosa TaxID=220873 RepID=A0ABQ9EST4_TEGGR|nr:hypothetical protein KUTeg_015711 [Tegillarca granosa]